MILVAGGTGRLGSLVVGNAVESGRLVRVLTRCGTCAEHLGPGVEVVTGDVREADAVRRGVDGCELVVNFVSVVDVAALVALAVADRTTRGEILEIGGPANLTLTELARAVQAAGGHDAAPRHVPPLLLRVAKATVGTLKPQVGRQAGMSLAMDRDDFTFDSGAIRDRFPRLPCTPIIDLLRFDQVAITESARTAHLQVEISDGQIGARTRVASR